MNIEKIIEDLKEAKVHSYHGYKNSFFGDLRVLYGSKQHRRSLFAVCGLWVYSAFNYYLIGYYVKYFPGDVFVNFMTMTIAEVIAPICLRLV